MNVKCPDEYNKLIKEKNKCIDECNKDNIYKYEYNNICYINCPNNTIKNESKCYDYNLINIDSTNINIINDEDIDIYREYINDDDIIKNVTQNKEDYTKEKDGVLYQITTTENQKNNINKNISTIDLGDCEKELKRIYQINESLPLIIFKIDYYSPDTLIPIVGYEIYHPLNKTKLDLKYCEEI